MDLEKLIAALMAKTAAGIADSEKIYSEADDAGMTEDQTKSFNAAMAQVDKDKAELKRLESMKANRSFTTQPLPARSIEPNAVASNTLEVKDLAPDPMAGFQSDLHYGWAVMQAYNKTNPVVDPLLHAIPDVWQQMYGDAPANTHVETGSNDGFMVPPAVAQELTEVIFDDQGIIAMVGAEPTAGNTVVRNRDDSTPFSSDGIVANWTNEASAITPSRLKTQRDLIELDKLAVFVEASEELLEDAPRLNDRLMRKAPEVINFKLTEAIVDGTGAGQPEGILQSPSLVTLTRTTPNEINADDVNSAYFRLLARGRQNAVWLAHNSVGPQFSGMVIGDRPIFQPPMGMADAPFGRLLGLRILYSEHNKALGQEGDLILANLKDGYFAARKVAGLKFAMSAHLFFNFDTMAFRWTLRFAGQSALRTAIAAQNGSDDYSHFVTIAT